MDEDEIRRVLSGALSQPLSRAEIRAVARRVEMIRDDAEQVRRLPLQGVEPGWPPPEREAL